MKIFLWSWLKKFMRKFCADIALKVYFLFALKGEMEMMAMLFAQKIILEVTTFEKVPKKLKQQVAKILIDECGVPELVPPEFGGTMPAA